MVLSVRAQPAFWPWFVLLVLSLGVVGGIAWDIRQVSSSLGIRSRAGSAAPRPRPAPVPIEQRRIRLFFPETSSRLFREVERSVPRAGTLAAEVRAVVAQLAAGETHGEPPSVPSTVQVRHVFVDGFGILYLDLSADFKEVLSRPHPQPELAVAAIVNTLTATFPDVKRVQILLDGQEIPFVAGPLDLGHPLSPHYPAADVSSVETPGPDQPGPP